MFCKILKFIYIFFLTGTLFSCKIKPDVSKTTAEKGSSNAILESKEGVFEIYFYKDAFEDGLDASYFGERTSINYESQTSGLKFLCLKNKNCKLTLDLKNEDFRFVRFKSNEGSAKFDAILNNEDSKIIFESLLTPWRSLKPAEIKLKETKVIEETKLVFLNYDKFGSIFCKRRHIPSSSIINYHYSCWFRYNEVRSLFDENTQYSNGDAEDEIWSKLISEISEK